MNILRDTFNAIQ